MPVHATRVLRTAGLVTRFSGHKQKSWSSQSRMGRRRGQSCFQHINVHLDIRKCPHAREAACVKMPTNTAAYDEQKSKARRIPTVTTNYMLVAHSMPMCSQNHLVDAPKQRSGVDSCPHFAKMHVESC